MSIKNVFSELKNWLLAGIIFLTAGIILCLLNFSYPVTMLGIVFMFIGIGYLLSAIVLLLMTYFRKQNQKRKNRRL